MTNSTEALMLLVEWHGARKWQQRNKTHYAASVDEQVNE